MRAAEAMIAADERVNGEFYVAPVYNRLIDAGARPSASTTSARSATGCTDSVSRRTYAEFLALPISRRAAGVGE